MTQHEKVLRYLSKNRRMTIRDGVVKLYINSPHKRVKELEEMGVAIKHIPVTKDGVRFVVYVLEPGQERVAELLEAWGGKNDTPEM